MEFRNLTTKREVAEALGIEYRELTYILYGKKIENLYKTFEIPKKNGGTRTINAPIEPLKKIQKTIANELSAIQREYYIDGSKNEIVQGFVRGRGIITNASIHRYKKYVFNIDLEDFFDCFHFGRVKGYFEKNKVFNMSSDVALCIAQLTCYCGKLPQGAPSSPVITNLICSILDRRLSFISRKYKLNYTRYADDLTFSTNDYHFIERLDQFYVEIKRVIEKSGLRINENKTRICDKTRRQEVTGLVVNEKVNVKREFYKNTRAMAHSLYIGNEIVVDGKAVSIDCLEGRFAFINQLDWYHNIKEHENKKHFNLNARETQYQLFLFYKYFYDLKRPLIVTEGKTDILYLKAAMKKLHVNYPNLIKKKSDGTFDYKISFLNRTKRLDFILGISHDGADAMKNIYGYFKGMNNHPDYWSKIYSLSKTKPAFPVIMIFDNEQITNRPLKGFLNFAKQKNVLASSRWTQLYENLYLVTNPLVNGKDECEIEDLFPEEVLDHEIGGKKFDRNSSDSTKFYGKAIFSKYVAADYQNIDFAGFIDFLTDIDRAIVDYQYKKK